MGTVDDECFVEEIADHLERLNGVVAVALGGSRAQGTARPDSDWDFGLYYRDVFHPQSLRGIGWGGYVSEIGEWGGGVFNGGAWLTVDGRRVDVLYRDLDVVEHQLDEARAGRFHIEHLLHHIAGIPSYLVVGELAVNRVIRGTLPRPEFPEALRTTASRRWATNADLVLTYADSNYATTGKVAQCAGLIAQATIYAAHAVLAAEGEWFTNEKRMLDQAGLRAVDRVLTTLAPDTLADAVGQARELCRRRLEAAGIMHVKFNVG